jgi:hypothetical protein
VNLSKYSACDTLILVPLSHSCLNLQNIIYLTIVLLLFIAFTLNCNSQNWISAYKTEIIKDGSGYSTYDQSIAVFEDSYGNAYHTGYFEGLIVFGNDTLISKGSKDIFIAKFNKSGYWEWANSAGGTLADYSKDITVNTNGEIFITGYYSGTSNFGNYQITALANTDIFVAKMNSQGVWKWASTAPGGGFNRGNSITADGSGNCYVTGNFESTVTFGSTNLTATGSKDIFVAKLNNAGNWIWAKKAGGSSSDDGITIRYSTNNILLVSGVYTGTSTFGSINLNGFGSKDIFVAKIDSAGNWIWASGAGSSSSEDVYGMDVDASGNTFITGTYIKAFNIGSSTLTATTDRDIYIAKINSSGVWQWGISSNGPGTDYSYSIGVDNSGNIYISGGFEQSQTFGTITVQSLSGRNGFIAKSNSSGTWQWVKTLAGNSTVDCLSIAVLSNGVCYATGIFNDNIIFGNDTLTSKGGSDIFIGKITTNGVWNYYYANSGVAGLIYSEDAVTDKNGNIIVTGYFYGNVLFGNDTLKSNGSSDIFIAKMNQTGTWLWAKSAGSKGIDEAKSVCTDSSENIYITGIFDKDINFGSDLLVNQGLSDIFIVKLSKNGEWIWAKSAGGGGTDISRSIEYDKSGSIVIAGLFQNSINFENFTLNSAGDNDIYISKLDLNGSFLWAVRGGGNQSDELKAISIDRNGKIYIVGSYESNAAFGGIYLSSQGGDDILIAALSSSGSWLWAKSAGSINYLEYGSDVNFDSKLNVYVTGTFKGIGLFGSQYLITNGLNDVFISKLDQYGNWIWSINFGSADIDIGVSLNIDASNNIYTAGMFTKSFSISSNNLTASSLKNSYLAKFDSSGNNLWALTDENTISGEPVSVVLFKNGFQALIGNYIGNDKFADIRLKESNEIDENIFIAVSGVSLPELGWTYFSNTGKNSTIILPADINPKINNRPIEIGDAVGVFFIRNNNYYCAGYNTWTGNDLEITVWGDDSSTLVKDGFSDNEKYNIIAWDALVGLEYPINVRYFSGPDNFQHGTISVISRFPDYSDTLKIPLLPGWNMISSYGLPINTDIIEVFSQINTEIAIVKDNYGNTFIPKYDINSILNWDVTKGYNVFSYSNQFLEIHGTIVNPENTLIYLNQGWNIVSYLRSTPMDIEIALEQLITNGNIVIVKDNEGNVYIPEFGINTIGNMKPGKGYQIYMNSDDSFVYPAE